MHSHMADHADWQLEEKVVALLEGHITSSASVKRNVDLPVLKSTSGRTRQCDVVIVEGNDPRKTISIVEVQKRQSKPEINEFNGWVEKMREVGAQHLICVSSAGFPRSIEEKADEIGPSIRLLTLKELEQRKWPIPSAICTNELEVIRYEKLLGLQMEGEHVFRVDPKNHNKPQDPDPHQKMFRLKDGRLLSATDIVDWHLFAHPKNLSALPKSQPIPLVVKFEWGWNEGLQFQDFGGTWVFLKGLLIQIRIHIRTQPLDWTLSAYEQRGWGEAAWILRGSAIIGGDSFDVAAPLKQVAPGHYSMGHPVTLGDFDAFVAFGDAGYMAQQFRG